MGSALARNRTYSWERQNLDSCRVQGQGAKFWEIEHAWATRPSRLRKHFHNSQGFAGNLVPWGGLQEDKAEAHQESFPMLGCAKSPGRNLPTLRPSHPGISRAPETPLPQGGVGWQAGGLRTQLSTGQSITTNPVPANRILSTTVTGPHTNLLIL